MSSVIVRQLSCAIDEVEKAMHYVERANVDNVLDGRKASLYHYNACLEHLEALYDTLYVLHKYEDLKCSLKHTVELFEEREETEGFK